VAREHGARVVHEAHRQISVARNAGARASQGQFLFFVDADSQVSRRLLRVALRRLIVDKWHGGGAALRFDPRPSRVFRLLEWSWNHCARIAGIGSGCFLFCRREVFETVGGFSAALYVGEDIAFSLAARMRGLPLRTVSRTPIVTSSRKFTQVGAARLAAMAVRFALVPWSVFSRDLCRLWYHRPGNADVHTRQRRRMSAVLRALIVGATLACGLFSCSGSGTSLRTRYITPTLLPGGEQMLVLRNDYTYAWHWMLLLGVEGDESPKTNAWTVERYDVNGSKLAELALGSWESRDTWSLNYAIVSAGDSRAILTRKDYADTSYLLDIEAMHTERTAGVFPDDQTVLDDAGTRAFSVAGSGQGISSIVETDLDGTVVQTVATVAANMWDVHISPSWSLSRACVAVWESGFVGILDAASQTLVWTSMPVVGVCSYGENRVLVRTDANRFVRAVWSSPTPGSVHALEAIDTFDVNDEGISDVSVDAAGTCMVYKSTPTSTDGDGNAEQPRIMRRTMATGATTVLLRESVEEL
jgi:hypothetical protein